MAQVFFPQRPTTHPMIYAYEDTNPQYRGLLKVGYTTVDVDRRVAQQYPTKRPALYETGQLMDWVYENFSLQAALDFGENAPLQPHRAAGERHVPGWQLLQ